MAPVRSTKATMLTVKPNPVIDFTLSTRTQVGTRSVHSLSSPSFKLTLGSYTTTVGLLVRRPLLWRIIRVSVGLTCTARQLFLRPPLSSINGPCLLIIAHACTVVTALAGYLSPFLLVFFSVLDAVYVVGCIPMLNLAEFWLGIVSGLDVLNIVYLSGGQNRVEHFDFDST